MSGFVFSATSGRIGRLVPSPPTTPSPNSDPGSVEYESARARLVTKLAEIGAEDPRNGYAALAAAVRNGEGVDIPSWVAMQLMTATTPSPDASPDSGEQVTLFREVDALGGTGMPEEGESWSRGYSEALSDVLSILAKRGFSEQSDARPSPSPAIVKEAGEVERLREVLTEIEHAESKEVARHLARAALSASNAAQVSK